MERSFRVSVIFFTFFTFCANPFILIANEVVSQPIHIPTQVVQKQESQKSDVQGEGHLQSVDAAAKESNKYRPKMYRKVLGGILISVGVVTIVSIVMFVALGFLMDGGGTFLSGLIICGVLAIFPLVPCIVGVQEFLA